MKFTQRNLTLLWLILSMALVAVTVAGASIAILYRTAYTETLKEMEHSAGTLAGIMEAVAQFDQRFSTSDHPQGARGATLSQIAQGLKEQKHAYDSEELIIGFREGDKIRVMRRMESGRGIEDAIVLKDDGVLAQPLHRALSSSHGSGELLDYKGTTVLAGYAPVPTLGIGVVYKVDLAEMRAPYLQAAIWSGVITLLAIGLGALSFARFVLPLQRRIESSEQRLRALVSAVPVGVYETDPQGHCTFVNEQWCALTGMRPEAAYGEGWARALHPDEQTAVHGAWNDFVAGHAPFQLQYRLCRPDGTVVQVYGQATELKDNSGNTTGYTGTITDLSQERRDRQAVDEAMKRLNEAQRIAKVGSWELDLAQNKLIWSDEIFRIFDLDKERFGASYEAFLETIHPDDRNLVNQAYSDSLINRQPYEIVHRLKMADDRIKYVRETCQSFFDAEGQPLRSVGTVQDITELHKTELELRQYRDHLEELIAERTTALNHSNQMLQTVLNTAPLRIFWKDRELNYLGCNRVFAEDAGKHSPQELIGKSDYDMAWKATADLYRQDDARVIETGQEKLSFEEPMELPDGSRIWLSTSKVPLRDVNGAIIGVLGTYENITARKQIEQALLTAKDEAERANHAKSEFLSRMSHELRTPLNAIIGFSQLLDSDSTHPLTPDQAGNAREILYAGRHLLELINEVLDLARIESGQVALTPQAVAVAQLIQECMALIQPLAAQRKIQMTFDAAGACNILADRLRLRQILLNLLSNAIKYNQEAGSVHIRFHPLDTGRLRIAVRDKGRGIAADVLPRLFKPFERMESAYDAIEGSGIGLALCRKLAEAMDGKIGVESTLGKGSTFWIELPLAGTESAQPAAPRQIPSVETGYATPRTLLYVEDNLANLRLVQKIIGTRKGLTLLEAHNAELGLALARTHRPDLILLDINLPGMNGFEALHQLRQDPMTHDIPVIAVTANAMERDVNKGLEAGFVDYLTKPLDVQRFMALVDKVLAELPRHE